MRRASCTLCPLALLSALAMVVAGCAEPGDSPLATSVQEEVLAHLDDEPCLAGVSEEDVRARIGGLLGEVESLEEAGALNRGQANALTNHLENALRHIDRGSPCPAEAQLNAFREQVDNLVEDGVLTNRQAFPLRHGWRILAGGATPPQPGAEAYAPGVVGELRTVEVEGEEVHYEVIDGLAIFQGDMILGYVDEFEAQVAAGAAAPRDIAFSGICAFFHFTCERWTDGTIGWDWAPGDWGDDSAMMVDRIRDALFHWQTTTTMRFERRTSGERLVFRNGSGCSSWVGRQVVTGLEPQWITLSPGCGLAAVIHEIGHAVGLYHEHSRDDRDDFIRIHGDQIEGGLDGPWWNFLHYGVLGIDVGPYDPTSRMHYACDAFQREDATGPTLEPIVDWFTCEDIEAARAEERLSVGDLLGIHTLYPPTVTILGAEPFQEDWRFRLRVDGITSLQDFVFWSSNQVDGDLGTGQILEIGPSDLPDGLHRITARVEILGEVVAQGSIQIRVFDPTPTIRIISPADGATFVRGVEPVPFAAEVELHDDPTHSLIWTSDRDGEIGSGTLPFSVSDLSKGEHVISATLTDEDRELSAADEVTMEITLVEPSVAILQPLDGSTFCTGETIVFEGFGWDPSNPDASGDPLYTWTSQPWDLDASGPRREHAFDEAESWEVLLRFRSRLDFESTEDRSTLQTTDCLTPPPSVEITQPATNLNVAHEGFDGFDEAQQLWFKDVELAGEGFEGSGEAIPGDDLVWTTAPLTFDGAPADAGEVVGTGHALTVRLYAADSCGSHRHLVTLTATDAAGEHTRHDRRMITIGTLC